MFFYLSYVMEMNIYPLFIISLLFITVLERSIRNSKQNILYDHPEIVLCQLVSKTNLSLSFPLKSGIHICNKMSFQSLMMPLLCCDQKSRIASLALFSLGMLEADRTVTVIFPLH